jgi:hypothetical protein
VNLAVFLQGVEADVKGLVASGLKEVLEKLNP